MKKRLCLLVLLLCCVGCKKNNKEDIAYVDIVKLDTKLYCESQKEDTLNNYKMIETHEFIYNSENILKSVNIKIKLELLDNIAIKKISSIIDNYKNMANEINNNNSNLYSGMNMNVYDSTNNFEISIYYDTKNLNKENINNLEFKDYIDNNFTFNYNKYLNDHNNEMNCTITLQ